MNLNEKKASKEFKKYEAKGEKVLKDKGKLDKLLEDAINVTSRKGPLDGFVESITLFISIIKDYVSGTYTDIPYGTIVAIVGALLYLISPIDLIPDVIPVIGIADDAFVLGLVLKQIHSDLIKYKEWKEQQSSIA